MPKIREVENGNDMNNMIVYSLQN